MNNLSGLGFDKVELLRAPQPRTSWRSLINQPMRSLLSSIPPERVGLNGEYDHYGLAKRVEVALQQCLGQKVVASLKISQRGQVVIFSGRSISSSVAQQLETVALSTEGAAFVEIYIYDVDETRSVQVA